MRQLLRRFHRRDEGQGLTEYALIIAVVAVCLIVIMQVARNSIGNRMRTAADDVSRTSTSSYGAPSAPGSVAGGWGGGYGGGGSPLPPADEGTADDDEDDDHAPADSVATHADGPTNGS